MIDSSDWGIYQYWMHRHIGRLSDVSLKHRSAILLLSVLMMFIDPNVELTFGNASLAGLGISFQPPQTIPLGLFLLALLIYRLIAFWATVLLESGSDSSIATRKALYEFDPAYEEEENRPHNMDALIKSETNAITYKWEARKILWLVVLPNVLAFGSLIRYFLEYITYI